MKFIEKPNPDEIIRRLVNAGVYILERSIINHIPAGRAVDFGKDVFPEMIQKGETIYGIVVKGGLRAIDTPEMFNQASRPDTLKEIGGLTAKNGELR